MGIFDKITKGITRGIGNAVSNATQKAVEKKATEILTPKINQAADTIAGKVEQSVQTANNVNTASNNSLETSLENLNSAMNAYATKVAQNVKVCPKCNATVSADKKFCPECGEVLPEKTLAQGSVCTQCGKQNSITEKYCTNCGTKLPQTIEAEQKQQNDDINVLNGWNEKLGGYPKWEFGGSKYYIEDYEGEYYSFTATFDNYEKACSAVENYRNCLQQNGFAPAGQYPSIEHLYKKVNGVCYHVDTEHCFEGDSNCPTIGFDNREPTGGFDYQEKPKKKKGLFGLFG